MEARFGLLDLERRIVRHDPLRDHLRRYLTDALTPEKLAAVWKQVDQGDLAAMVETAEEIEAKEPRIFRLAARRRESLSEVEWEIAAPPDDELPELSTPEDAKAVADVLRRDLQAIRSFSQTVDHLITGITSGLAVSELIWRRGVLVDTQDVPANRLNATPWKDPDVRVIAEDNWIGYQARPGKFMVFAPTQRVWQRTKVVLPRAASVLYMAKHFAITDWLAYAEIFGMPWRIARIADAGNDELRKQVKKWLSEMAADSFAVMPMDVELQFAEASRSSQPFGDLIAMIHDEMSILYLGQTLTTDIGDRGSFAATKVHANVAASISMADMRKESHMMRDQLLRPMAALRFPRREVPIPYFKRRIVSDQNLEAERLKLEKLKYADARTFPVDDQTRADILDLPIPEHKEELTPILKAPAVSSSAPGPPSGIR